jgi:ABC-type Fe3+ transport system substrate-binding protein
MTRNLTVFVLAAVVVGLPFLLRRPPDAGAWRAGDPVLVIVSPHNEAIRYEFGRAFSDWHAAKFGPPVKIEWLNVGGTTETSRYLVSEFSAAMRAWWRGQGHDWPAGAAEAMTARTPKSSTDIHRAFRELDDPGKVTVRIDLFFGGGEYDHTRAFQQGLTVPPWPAGREPREVLDQIPPTISGETWRTPAVLGTTVSTFGICFNRDRLRDLGVQQPPARWADLADPVYLGQVGVADPTKSGSVAKAFEMIVQQQCDEAVHAAGYSDEQIDAAEKSIAAGQPASPEYQAAVERGWLAGIRLVQRIGANARYFTDSASKVPVDVAAGDATAGLAIDFYARFQAQVSRAPDGTERMGFVTPIGGSSVSADPISLLRGAPNRPVAVRFIEFALSEEGQRLWTYRPGAPGGPQKYALRRLPIRRDFYEQAARHQPFASEPLDDPSVNPYALAQHFVYRPRWTGRHFGIQRDIVRAMCLDSAVELRAAWEAIVRGGGPARQAAAMEILQRMPTMPEPLTWVSAPAMSKQYDRLDYMREWTAQFRENYRRAREAVR